MDWDFKGNLIIKNISLEHKEKRYKSTLCITKYDEIPKDSVILKNFMGAEYQNFKDLKYERRKKSYFLGRYSCMAAINKYIGYENQNILIQNGIFNQPLVIGCHDKTFQVSITHSGDIGGAIVYDDRLIMGLDIEAINSDHREAFESHLTDEEKLLIQSSFSEYLVGLTKIWTAKESLSKALKTGMMTPFNIFELDRIKNEEDYCLCYYKNFPQYISMVFTIHEYACSITYPAHMGIYWI